MKRFFVLALAAVLLLTACQIKNGGGNDWPKTEPVNAGTVIMASARALPAPAAAPAAMPAAPAVLEPAPARNAPKCGEINGIVPVGNFDGVCEYVVKTDPGKIPADCNAAAPYVLRDNGSGECSARDGSVLYWPASK